MVTFFWEIRVEMSKLIELDKAYKICIPKSNVLTDKNFEILQKIARGPTHSYKLNKLLLEALAKAIS